MSQLLPVTRIVTEVVHQDDLPDEVLRAPVEDTHDGPQEGGPGLVVKCDDHGGGLQFSLPVQSLAGGAPCVGDLPVAGDLVAGLLIELVPRVFVLPDLETVASDVGFLSKVLPVDLVFFLTTLIGVKEIQRPGYPDESTQTQVLDLPLHVDVDVEVRGETRLDVHGEEKRRVVCHLLIHSVSDDLFVNINLKL